MRIPLVELAWVKAQREKSGSKSQYVITSIDQKETKRQTKNLNRKEYNIRISQPLQNHRSMNDEFIFSNDDIDNATKNETQLQNEVEIGVEEIGNAQPNLRKSNTRTRNRDFNITMIAESSLRFGVSAAATASIINSTINCLANQGFINIDYKYLFCDKNKVLRAKNVALNNATEENATLMENP